MLTRLVAGWWCVIGLQLEETVVVLQAADMNACLVEKFEATTGCLDYHDGLMATPAA